MWGSFALASIAGLLIIMVPGMLVLRSLRFSSAASFVFAAPLSAAIIAFAGVLCHRLGFDGALPLIIGTLIATAAACVCFLVAMRLRRSAATICGRSALPSLSWKDIALYVVVGAAVMAYLYLRCLASPESIVPIGDINYHVNVVKSMMDGGNFSTLDVSPYPLDQAQNTLPYASSMYYPAAWHVITALAGQIAGASAMAAENATMFVFCGIVFPLSVLGILGCLFPQKPSVARWGAVTALGCVMFPLRPLLVHQLFPAIAGFCCILSVAACFFMAVKGGAHAQPRGRWMTAFILGFIGLGVLHPGAFLACAVFCFFIVLCKGVPRAADWLHQRYAPRFSRRIAGVGLGIAWAAAGIIIWLVVLNLPALASTTNFLWTWTVEPWKALYYTVTMGLSLGIPQFALAVLVWTGFGWCCKGREFLWVGLAFLFFCIVFFFNACGAPELKRLFAGFWYTDSERSSALVAIAAAPLTAIGLDLAFQGLKHLLAKAHERFHGAALSTSGQRALSAGCAAVAAALFALLVFLPGRLPLPIPGFHGESGFDITRAELRHQSDAANSPLLTADEERFVDEALAEIERRGDGSEALIINMPHDGSLFSYPMNDANVYYKSYDRGWRETEASKAIRTALDEAATREDVQRALAETGAEYVLVLNHDEGENYDSNAWKAEDWTGFDDLDDATPGFEPVLADGDMRLYRITALAS